MRRSRFTEAQIIGMIKEQEAGMPTAEVCRRHVLSPASFYKFKSKFGGMNISETHRLKSLEDKNGKLKRLLADTMLDNVVLKDLLGKHWRHQLSDGLQHLRRCGIMISRSAGCADLWCRSENRSA
jgi:putative transposase